jgi:hypothetical protein
MLSCTRKNNKTKILKICDLMDKNRKEGKYFLLQFCVVASFFAATAPGKNFEAAPVPALASALILLYSELTFF